MTPDPDALDDPAITVIDGGTGSELRRRGFPMRPDVWSALAGSTHYELLRDVHASYLAAGADVITTNTFATTRFVLDAAGLGERFEEINARTVAAAHEARDAEARSIAIAGSLSCLPPAFDVARYPPPAAEARAYAELAELLAAAGVDLLVLEMMQETEHAVRACEAARATGLPFWLGVSCRLRADRLVAYDFPDVPLERCLEALLPYEPAAVCVMHTPLDAVVPALELVRSLWSGPLGAYPELPAGARGATVPPHELAAAAEAWLTAGATIVGGCCGATPAHIRALSRLRDAR